MMADIKFLQPSVYSTCFLILEHVQAFCRSIISPIQAVIYIVLDNPGAGEPNANIRGYIQVDTKLAS